jgi:hypothetical protein
VAIKQLSLKMSDLTKGVLSSLIATLMWGVLQQVFHTGWIDSLGLFLSLLLITAPLWWRLLHPPDQPAVAQTVENFGWIDKLKSFRAWALLWENQQGKIQTLSMVAGVVLFCGIVVSIFLSGGEDKPAPILAATPTSRISPFTQLSSAPIASPKSWQTFSKSESPTPAVNLLPTSLATPAPIPPSNAFRSFQAVWIYLPSGDKVECEFIMSSIADTTSWDEIWLSLREFVVPEDTASASPSCTLQLDSLRMSSESETSGLDRCKHRVAELFYDFSNGRSIPPPKSVIGYGGCEEDPQGDSAAIEDAVGRLRTTLRIFRPS